MKKIDLHLHTVPTVSDAAFTFDLNVLQRYVSDAALDAVAITNHNVFDGNQFAEICEALDIVAFPGIEVTLDCGHVLIIADVVDLDTFKERTEMLAARITQARDSISIDGLLRIFPNLSEYLVIPHYEKAPALKGEALQCLAGHVCAGEVDSPKKFIRAIRDETRLTPVLFSDIRICDALDPLPTRQTFVDCGEVTLAALKTCLQDKGKVALSATEGNSLFQAFDDGQKLSTGLNVLLGARSTGKTFTLDRINASHDRVKYIRQFELVQQDEVADERQFSRGVSRTRSEFAEEYLAGFKGVLSDVMTVDLRADDRALDDYLGSLLESAAAASRRDAFSNTTLFDESAFPLSEDQVLIDLIASARQVIENVEYRGIIDKYVDSQSLKRLVVELIELLWAKRLEAKKKAVNDLVRDIKANLRRRTSAVQVEDVDLYRVMLNRKKSDLEPKQFKQVANRISALSRDPYPADCKHLSGHPGFRRIDIGEFRVCYKVDGTSVLIAVAAHRNDDTAYRELAEVAVASAIQLTGTTTKLPR